ncbi:MAG: DUF3667 domain-containing protein [Flavobacteriales bacterium]|nr:DUF3667 domain-containing protein [Flavobacteriales bacterium]MCB9173518.1 DUF3667 domain-containing protein [Flavobacteriales bacterium]
MKTCLNCNNKFEGNYCNNCGQKDIEVRITLKMIFTDFAKTYFSVDTTVYKTLIGLISHPGQLINDYLAGKRKLYFAPFQFFLLFMTIYLLTLNYFGDGIFEMFGRGIQSDNQTAIKNVEVIQAFVRKNLNLLYFVLTPVLAYFIKVFFKKNKFNFAETLIFSFYIVGVGAFLSTFVAFISLYSSKLFILKAAIILGYFPFAIAKFTNQTGFLGFMKSFFTVLLSYIVFLSFVVLLGTLYVFFFLKQ